MSELWATPQALFDKLHGEFQFVLDVCALPTNAKCHHYFTPEQDGLAQSWNSWMVSLEAEAIGRCAAWMNPPYGRGIGKWMEKAYHTANSGSTVVCLIPNRSNAPWWHEYVMKAHEIRFVKHKVAFDVPQTQEYEKQDPGVPFWGSVIVVFRSGGTREGPRVSTYMQPKHENNLISTT